MEKQISLFGVGLKENVTLKDEVKVVKPKIKLRKGLIRINNLNSKENPFGVDFDGFQEGSGSPCANEDEVQECVKNLIERNKAMYNIEIKDNRIEQKELNKIKAETICPIVVCEQIEDKIVEKETYIPKHFLIDVENRSSGEYAIFPKVAGEMFCASYCGKIGDGKKIEEIEAIKKSMIEKGFIFDKVMEHTYTYPDDEPKFVEDKIKTLSEELKKYLKKKYKYDVTIRVLKSDEVKK